MDHIGLIASDMDYTLLDENGQLPGGFAEKASTSRRPAGGPCIPSRPCSPTCGSTSP